MVAVQPKSLFKIDKNTFEVSSGLCYTSAYKDYAAVMGKAGKRVRFLSRRKKLKPTLSSSKILDYFNEGWKRINHPTAISPFAGRRTGSGGEI